MQFRFFCLHIQKIVVSLQRKSQPLKKCLTLNNIIMKSKLYLALLILVSFCSVACGTHPEPGQDDPKEQTDPKTDTPEVNEIKVTPTQINAPAEGGEYTLDIKSNIKWSVSSNVSWVTCNPGVGKNNDKVTVTVEKSNVAIQTSAIITIGEYGGSSVQKVEVVVTRSAVEGSNLFSVADTRKVVFSPGNLQYQASTKTWRFAEHQYDIIGGDNKNISDTYDGWIDLFGWGTGNNPTLASTNDDDYATFTDWGVNKISNGGNEPAQWRTLTYGEMTYLCEKRTNADKLYSQATVNGVCGCVFLPDNWILPDGLSFTPVAKNWTTNTYSVADWTMMEQNGAVFLPTDGYYRVGLEMTLRESPSSGAYWSSTATATQPGRAWSLTIRNNLVTVGNSLYSNGYSVRLVKEKK